MRLALVVAPQDARLGDAASRRETLAWLRANLARFGFHVVIIGGGADPQGDLARAVDKVSAGDTVLVHASGRLSGRDSLACGEAGVLSLGMLSAALAARAPGHVSFVAELLHESDAGDPLLATQLLDEAVQALGARELGYPVLAAVRPLASAADRVAFTRLALPPASDHVGPPPTEAIVSAMYDQASSTPDSHAVAQSFTFVRGTPPAGAADPAPPPSADYASMPPPAAEGALSIHSQIAEATELRDWPRALMLRRARLETLASPGQRSRELVAIARILQAELGDADGAIAALEMARAIDPKRASVLLALRRGYEKLGRWNNALEVLNALGPLAPSVAERVSIRVAQARILLERVGDRARAVEWLEAAVADDPDHAEAAGLLRQIRPAQEVDVASLEKRAQRLLAGGRDDEALDQLEAIAAREPARASVYETLFAAHRRAGRTDAAFLAALALEELDAADVDQQMLVDQFRSVGPIRVREPLDEQGWAALRAPGADPVLERLFSAIERAAVASRVEELRERRALATLDPAERLSETSTATIGRTFHWAARALSIPAPQLYVRGAGGPAISAVQAREPCIALGPSAVSGRPAKDLAFMAGRQLAYLRPEYHVLLYYPTREEMTALLLAAAQVAMPESAADSSDEAVRALRARLARQLDQRAHRESMAALRSAVRELDARGGQAALGAWMCSAELTAGRAGLLLCGDLATATAIVRAEPGATAHVHADARRGDLVAFCASRSHAGLRGRFAVAAPASVLPAAAPAELGAAPA